MFSSILSGTRAKKNGREFVDKNFNRDYLADQYLSIIRSVVKDEVV